MDFSRFTHPWQTFLLNDEPTMNTIAIVNHWYYHVYRSLKRSNAGRQRMLGPTALLGCITAGAHEKILYNMYIV